MPASTASHDSDDLAARLEGLEKVVDVPTFIQILEMDDDPDDREFSRSIVFGFVDQAEETFASMKTAIENRELQKSSQLGHFLKGSSATLGLNSIRDICEKMQHYGSNKDETGENDVPDDDLCLKHIAECLDDMRALFVDAVKAFRVFFASPASDDDEEDGADEDGKHEA